MRCPECNKLFKIHWIMNKRQKDEMGHFYIYPECGTVISPQGGYWTIYKKLKEIAEAWKILEKGLVNKNITIWI